MKRNVSLKKLMEGIDWNDSPKVDRYEVSEGVRQYSQIGQSMFKENNIIEVAKQLHKIVDGAQQHIVSEQDDWFDKVTINRNMSSLKGMVKEFKKSAVEASQLDERLKSLYEDMGGILNRYYDIDEVMAEADKGDMDNDGISEPDDEEYLDNKDDAIKKAMAETARNLRPTRRLRDIK
jgi:ATP-dependent 26S proteasome regulatory subunit